MPLRPRHAARGRLLLRHRELRPLVLAAASPASRRTRCIDFFPDDFLLIVDESHVTLPQVRGMFAGDRSRKDDARRARLPPAQRPRQPAAAVRRVREADRSTCLCLSATPGPYELETDRRRGGRAGDPADRAGRSGHPRQAGPRPGAGPRSRRSASGPRRKERTLVTTLTKRHGRGPDELLPRRRPALQVAALRTRRHRAHAGPARAARGGVRRAGRREPAARRARPAGGVAGRDPRRGQGRLPALARRR